MIPEALGTAPGQIGFRRRTALDHSPETLRKTRIAVARAKEGDPEAVRFLYVSYSHNVYGYVRAIVRDDHEAEDVTQHVFANVITTLAKYDDRVGPFCAWLFRLAHNVAIDHLRSNRVTPMEKVRDPETNSGADLNRAETVRTALATLHNKQRQVVLLREVAGFSHAEIAERMGQTEGSVRALHHRGRRAMQRELKRLETTPFTRETRHLLAA